MARKRKTLPKDFGELLAGGDLSALQQVFARCELDALGGDSQCTALGFEDCPEELARWLVSQGLDVDAPGRWGHTPLIQKAGRDQDLTLLLELGADVNAVGSSGLTALHAAVPRSPRNVAVLLAHHANMSATDERGRTPLGAGLRHCSNSEIQAVAGSARILLDAGSPVPTDAGEQVIRIAKQFQVLLENRDRRHYTESIAALDTLYEMFGVAPVAPRRVHDGTSPISARATGWADQFNELWDYLVPSSGEAATVQGEVIRLAGRISHELLDNGGVNWDRGHTRMKDSLVAHLASGNRTATPEELTSLAAGIGRDRIDTATLNRMAELAVQWVLANPDPVPLA